MSPAPHRALDPRTDRIVGPWAANWSADLKIWENKVSRDRPVLISLDGPVHAQRRGFRPFCEDDRAAHRAPAVAEAVSA